MERPLQSADMSCGGGVWRVSWHPLDKSKLLCACMQNGFAVVSQNQVRSWASYSLPRCVSIKGDRRSGGDDLLQWRK